MIDDELLDAVRLTIASLEREIKLLGMTLDDMENGKASVLECDVAIGRIFSQADRLKTAIGLLR